MIIHGDCLEKLKELKDNSIDAIITDPPYGLKFMGKNWDYDVPAVSMWVEALRVLKPGGHLLAFGGTRTYHRLVVNIEDAGFEIRDQVMWLYGSGFPKSHDVSKGIDKQAGAEREIVGKSRDKKYSANGVTSGASIGGVQGGHNYRSEFELTKPSTDEAKQWQGWGTALKPANEPICLARKPLEKGLTIAQNVLKYGTGALNIDASRIEGAKPQTIQGGRSISGSQIGNNWEKEPRRVLSDNTQGRWPANVLLDEQAAFDLDEQSGNLKSGKLSPHHIIKERKNISKGFEYQRTRENDFGGDEGGASRFFYVAKASKSERNAGLDSQSNGHPCVKPIKLMEYLIKLITPPDGTVLDPFAGSGSTGVACKRLGFKFVGIEREKEYVEIAEKRISAIEI